MPKLVAVSQAQHSRKRWRSFESNFRFAAKTALAPLVAAELPKAMMTFPIAFVRFGRGFTPAALLSLEQNRNLFVADDGRWIGSYQPAILRSFPFQLAPADNDRLVLCVDEESGLISESSQGEHFFDEGGLSQKVGQVLDFLKQVEANKVLTLQACAALEEYGLIIPWPVQFTTDQGVKKIEGLFRIDERLFNELSSENFSDLRKHGAISIAYSHIFSCQHTALLRKLYDMHNARKEEGDSIIKRSFQSHSANEIDIDWGMFSENTTDT